MERSEKILVLGGTGAMGVYLVEELLSMGYHVDVISLDERVSANPRLTYSVGNIMDDAYMAPIFAKNYDAIVDYMIYPTTQFMTRSREILKHTRHYIYLSSYRVYGDRQIPITESAPQLLDYCDDKEFLASDDYTIKKCKGEDILEQSGFRNWTAIRPAVTYSQRRFQLITLEANAFVDRARQGKKVLVPREALPIEATMTWAGDVAKMVSRLILREDAFSDYFTVSTAEHHTWETIVGYYHDLIGLEVEPVDMETFLSVIEPDPNNHGARWQLVYDRLMNRIMDNSKILAFTGLKQEDFMPLYDGLKLELSRLGEHPDWNTGSPMTTIYQDRYFGE